ncbi:hypothetical protein CNYM01_12931 [Colletotrichum nymphaeae SA-01]|uniref:Uncharacterized protein n=1 Tax=Colletotrichum nymphaeae SA-01 TaxID=1460502 RepID=A0A135TRN6_9PEZI|nr:hypothetical protein CNYM01_12931 [Colletotrichum nymphaeae SA-01]
MSKDSICPRRKTQARFHGKFNVKSVEDGSLHATLIKNSGLRLFVKPIKWTGLHLTLLDMKFHNLPPLTQPVPTVDSSKATIDLSASAQALLGALNTLLEAKSTECRTRSILTVISMLYPQNMSFLEISELHQYFDGRAYCIDCPVQAAWDVTPARSSYTTANESTSLRAKESVEGPIVENIGGDNVRKQPGLVYVDLKTIAVTRRARYKPPRNNPPVRRLRKLLYRKVTPPNMVEDPFLAAVVLALAQRPFYKAAPPSADKPLMSSPESSSLGEPIFQDTTVCILAVNDKEPPAPCFVLYRGKVRKELLQKFHNPTKNYRVEEEEVLAGTLKGSTNTQIQYTEVPIWPILGLKERLGRALGKEIAGPFDENNIEMWEQDPKLKTQSRAPAMSRKEILGVWQTSERATTKTR